MAKTTVHGGGSLDPVPSPRVKRPMLGGEPKLVGTNSSTSSKNEKQKGEDSDPSHQQPAQTTESHLAKEKKDSSATSTVGDGPKMQGAKSGKKRTSVRSTEDTADDDFDDFN